MNRKQRLVVALGILGAVLMALFPPWSRYLPNSDDALGFAGFHPVFGEPEPPPEAMSLDRDGVWRAVEEARIDVDRLLFQLGILGAVVLLGAVALGDRRARPTTRAAGFTYHRSPHFDEDD